MVEKTGVIRWKVVSVFRVFRVFRGFTRGSCGYQAADSFRVEAKVLQWRVEIGGQFDLARQGTGTGPDARGGAGA